MSRKGENIYKRKDGDGKDDIAISYSFEKQFMATTCKNI